MGKAATRPKRTTTTNNSDDPTVDYLAALDAKQRFVSSALNMGWRLVITFIIPLIIGAWLDRRYDTAPSYTITGLFLAIAASAYIIWDTVKDVNAETAELDKLSKKSGRKKNV